MGPLSCADWTDDCRAQHRRVDGRLGSGAAVELVDQVQAASGPGDLTLGPFHEAFVREMLVGHDALVLLLRRRLQAPFQHGVRWIDVVDLAELTVPLGEFAFPLLDVPQEELSGGLR